MTDHDRFETYEENPLRQLSVTGGMKDNKGKPQVDLLSSVVLLATAEVLSFGTRKYKPHNWRLGLSWSQTYSSLMRHLLAWQDGEETDPETGLSHLAHAMCQLMFLTHYSLTGTGEDDRYVTTHPAGGEGELRTY